jgi:hypothetical protein
MNLFLAQAGGGFRAEHVRSARLIAEISDRAFDPGLTEQKLDSPEIPCAPIDQHSLGSSQRVCVPNSRGSGPTLPIHSETSMQNVALAYCVPR